MNTFAHREVTSGWPPRHPIVCIENIIGFAITVGLMFVYRPTLASGFLIFVIELQYLVSATYHWLPLNERASKIDRSVIFVLIGATYVAYWGTFMSAEVALFRLQGVAVVVIIGVVLVESGASSILIGVLWALFAGAGPIISASMLWHSLSFNALIAFGISVLLYGAHQFVFARKWPDPVPGLFGYTEVRHLILPFATTINCLVVLQYA